MDPDAFRCPICLDIVDKAVETICCGKAFCLKCIKGVQGTACPHCRHQNYKYNEVKSINRALETIKINCPLDCDFQCSAKEMDAHKRICPKKEFLCPADGCGFKSTKRVFAAHLVDAHVDVLVNNVAMLFVKDEDITLDNLATVFNNDGRIARLGENGKFYCGGPRVCKCVFEDSEKEAEETAGEATRVDGEVHFYTQETAGEATRVDREVHCYTQETAGEATRVDGEVGFYTQHYNTKKTKTVPAPKICGYLDGCNCRACEQLDIKARNLNKSWHVNNSGSPCQRSKLNQLFYCGRRQFPEDNQSTRLDNYCGPRQGPQCKACVLLQEHVDDKVYD